MSPNNSNIAIISAAFSQVADKLVLFWGEPEFTALIDELQQNRRGESRTGFPVPVLMAIEDLAEEHDHAFPELARVETDFWNLSKAR